MAGPGDKVAEAIMMLMQQGRQRGMPMEASPELMQYLANVRTSTPDAASFDSMNVDLMPTRETPEDLYARFAGVEMPPPISRDPWFDQELPPVDFEVTEGTGQTMDPARAEEMRAFMRDLMGGPQPGTQSSGGNWYIKIRDARGKVARADGPFTSEIEAHRAMRNYRSETGRQGSNFFIEQD